tara:strand:- start:343 stop:546 length:204 start_codon:yes stop_codon:yes gene_type:complete
MKAIETNNFQSDITSIDQFVSNKIAQVTWQNEPIELNGKQYIKYKSFLDDWLDGKEVVEIEIPSDDV